jgi:Holliday junction DNA helicase RuvA
VSGLLAEKSPMLITVDVNGIGFELNVPVSTSQKLPSPGAKVKLFTHFVVREDAQLLFGFGTEEERTIFKLLLSVNGIGPKSAMTILSGVGITELKRAIVQGSLPVLTAISGIGRKTAERLIIELREKIIVEGDQGEKTTEKLDNNNALVQDSLQALIQLGYSKQGAKAAIQKAMTHSKADDWKVEDLIRASLKYM